jgi:hypothetical protein
MIVASSFYSSSSGQWSEPQYLSSCDSSTQSAYDLSLTMNTGGDAVAIWRQNTSITSLVSVVNFINGAWGNSQTLSTSDCMAYSCQVGIDTAGNAMAGWVSNDQGNIQFHSSSFSSGTWSASSVVLQENAQPILVMKDSGNAFLVWSTRSHSGYVIKAMIYANGAWNEPQILDSQLPNVIGPVVDVDDSGNGIIAWTSYTNSYPIIEGCIKVASLSNESLGEPLIIGDALPLLRGVDVAVNDSGQVTAVWTSLDRTHKAIMVSTGQL